MIGPGSIGPSTRQRLSAAGFFNRRRNRSRLSLGSLFYPRRHEASRCCCSCCRRSTRFRCVLARFHALLNEIVRSSRTSAPRLHSSAHSSPSTPEEAAAYKALQESSYHCAPVIAAYTAARKRSWAQKILGPTSAFDDSQLFLDGAFSDVEQLAAEGKKLLACNEVQETTIKNHTCVLGTFPFLPISSESFSSG
jgi:hypothetical protein